MKKLYILMVVGLAAFAAVACSTGGGDTAEPTAVPTSPAAAAAPPTPTTEPEPAPEPTVRPDMAKLNYGPRTAEGLQAILGTGDLGVGTNRFGFVMTSQTGFRHRADYEADDAVRTGPGRRERRGAAGDGLFPAMALRQPGYVRRRVGVRPGRDMEGRHRGSRPGRLPGSRPTDRRGRRIDGCAQGRRPGDTERHQDAGRRGEPGRAVDRVAAGRGPVPDDAGRRDRQRYTHGRGVRQPCILHETQCAGRRWRCFRN